MHKFMPGELVEPRVNMPEFMLHGITTNVHRNEILYWPKHGEIYIVISSAHAWKNAFSKEIGFILILGNNTFGWALDEEFQKVMRLDETR
jgi:hypothetical protein